MLPWTEQGEIVPASPPPPPSWLHSARFMGLVCFSSPKEVYPLCWVSSVTNESQKNFLFSFLKSFPSAFPSLVSQPLEERGGAVLDLEAFGGLLTEKSHHVMVRPKRKGQTEGFSSRRSLAIGKDSLGGVGGTTVPLKAQRHRLGVFQGRQMTFHKPNPSTSERGGSSVSGARRVW